LTPGVPGVGVDTVAVDVCFFCSKMEILSDRGVIPGWFSLAAIFSPDWL